MSTRAPSAAPQPPAPMSTDSLVAALKAAAEPTRLRILVLLEAGELNVKDLTQILGQSQPRLSRHLKLLVEASLIERFREGSWAYFQLPEHGDGGRLAQVLLAAVDRGDPVLQRDRERADGLKREREKAAQRYFEQHAGDWDRLRSLHVPEREVEAAMRAAMGPGPFPLLVDVGTGTGRMLELFSGSFGRAIGFDVNQAMLAFARANLGRARIANAHVRQGDLYNLPLDPSEADAVVMHQVLHYLSDPQLAIAEAARILKPGGRLLVVDFAPHEFEFLREEHAHERLGISQEAMQQWLAETGLELASTEEMRGRQTGRMDDQTLTVTLWLAMKPQQAGGAALQNSAARARRPALMQET